MYTPNIYAGANPGFPNGEKKVTMKSARVYLIDLETHLPDALQKSQIVPSDFLIWINYKHNVIKNKSSKETLNNPKKCVRFSSMRVLFYWAAQPVFLPSFSYFVPEQTALMWAVFLPLQAMLKVLPSKCPALPAQGLSHRTHPPQTPTQLLCTLSGAPTPNRTPMHRSVLAVCVYF